MRLFSSSEDAIRFASRKVLDWGVPFAITYTDRGFHVVDLRDLKPTHQIAEVLHDLAETIRFSDHVPAHERGPNRSLTKSP